jgi:hypothetical protein
MNTGPPEPLEPYLLDVHLDLLAGLDGRGVLSEFRVSDISVVLAEHTLDGVLDIRQGLPDLGPTQSVQVTLERPTEVVRGVLELAFDLTFEFVCIEIEAGHAAPSRSCVEQ